MEINCPQCGAPTDAQAAFCKNCGAALVQPVPPPPPPQYAPPTQYAQPQYAQPQYAQPQQPVYSTDKNKVTAGILGILLGGIGVHKFYLGRVGFVRDGTELAESGITLAGLTAARYLSGIFSVYQVSCVNPKAWMLKTGDSPWIN